MAATLPLALAVAVQVPLALALALAQTARPWPARLSYTGSEHLISYILSTGIDSHSNERTPASRESARSRAGQWQ